MGASGSKFKEQVAKKTKEDRLREKAFREQEALVVDDDAAIGAIGEKILDGVLLVHAHGSLDESKMTLTDPRMVVMTFCRVGDFLICNMPFSYEKEKTFILTQFESGNPLLLKDVTQFEVDERRIRNKYPEYSACVNSIRLRVGSERGTKFTSSNIFGGLVFAHDNEWEGLFYCDKRGCRDVTEELGVKTSPSKYIYEPTSQIDFEMIEYEKSLHLFNDVVGVDIDNLFELMVYSVSTSQPLLTEDLIETIIKLFIPPEQLTLFKIYLDSFITLGSMISFDSDGIGRKFYKKDSDVSVTKQRITFLKSLNVFPNQTSGTVHLTLDVDKKFMFLACMLFRGDSVENLQRIYDDIVNLEKGCCGMLFSLKKSDTAVDAFEQHDDGLNKSYFMGKNHEGRVHVLFLSILRMIQRVQKRIEQNNFAELSKNDKRTIIMTTCRRGSFFNLQWVMSKYEETDFSTIIPTLRSELMVDPTKELLVSLPVCRGIRGCPPPPSFEHSPHGSESEGDVNDIGGGKKKQNNKKQKTKQQNNKTTKQQNNKTTKQQNNKKTKKTKQQKNKKNIKVNSSTEFLLLK